jgi:hypothetical protein
MNKEEILKQIEDFATQQEDKIIALRDITFSGTTGKFHLLPSYFNDDEISFCITTHALNQILSRLGIPIAYFKRCDHSLQQANANYWLDFYARKQLLFRFMNVNKEEGVNNTAFIRAVVGKRFKTDYDDVNTLPVFLDQYESLIQNPIYQSYIKDTDITQVNISSSTFVASHNNLTVNAGVMFINSETGLSCLHIKPYVYCRGYGAENFIYDAASEGTTSFYHTSKYNEENIKQAIVKATEVAQIGIAQVFKADTEYVDPIIELNAITHERAIFSSKLVSIVEDDLKRRDLTTRFQVAQSILTAVKDLPIFQKHLATTIIGSRLGLFGNSTKRLAKIINCDLSEGE